MLFHPSYWNPHQTDRLHVISPSIFWSTWERQTDKLCFISPTNWNIRRQTFHPSYWTPSMIDGQTTVHFTPHIWIYARHYARQTDKLCFINFYSSYWNLRKTEGYFCFIQSDKLSFISPLILVLKQNRRTNYVTCYNIKIKFIFLSYLDPNERGKMKQSLSVCLTSIPIRGVHAELFTGRVFRLPFHFTPLIGIQVRQTDKLRFI